MQAASDLFLGWSKGPFGRHFYIRQLRDMKFSADIELMDAIAGDLRPGVRLGAGARPCQGRGTPPRSAGISAPATAWPSR
jgi:hypothetical protein